MRIVHLFAVAAAVATAAAPAAAKPLETEQFKASAEISIEPGLAYLLVRSPGRDLKLLREPTQAERVAYQAERAEALAKALARYERAEKRYERDLERYRDRLSTFKPKLPVMPTEANLAFRAIESDNFVTVWGGRVFDNSGPATAHLIAVPPGTYRLYGRVLEGANGSIGICLCMGTVQFDAAPGTITDMGTIHYPLVSSVAEGNVASWNGLTPGRGGLTAMRVEPADSSVHVPAKLAELPRVAADYRASGKMNNFFGLMVERLTPLPGVLAYRRDEIVDERTGRALGSH